MQTCTLVVVAVKADDLFDMKDAGPTQPILLRYLQTVFGDQNRALNLSLEERFSFTEYSVKKDSVYCFTGRRFAPRAGDTGCVLTDRSYRNWKRCHAALPEHATSKSHPQAAAFYDLWRRSEMQGLWLAKLKIMPISGQQN
jgi:hypothetical protein